MIDATHCRHVEWLTLIQLPTGKMKLEFLENPSSSILEFSLISNLIQAHFWDFLKKAC